MRASARGVVALGLGVALPTALLGAGWLLASLRERDAREHEARARLEGIALAVRGAVDESLAELIAREDASPFYLYNHYYVPPDVLAISDAIAISPLAGDPHDPRVVGYFQIDPDGTVRTPYTASPTDAEDPRAARVLLALRDPGLSFLAELVRGRESGALVAVSTPSVPAADAGPRVRLARADRTGVATDEVPTPEGPVTVSLNTYGNLLATDLAQAQEGDQGSYERVQQRGRAAPITERRTVGVEVVQRQQAERQDARVEPVAPSASSVGSPRTTPRARPRARVEVPAPLAPAPPLVPRAIAVDYTPMELRRAGDQVVLHRLVSHEGAAVVQGVVLDRRELVERWIPSVAARHAAGGPVPTIVESDSAGDCALTRPISAHLEGALLCFDARALAGDTTTLDTELRFQLGALLGLLSIVLFATFAVYRAAQRADSLSRQKTAFVSAVSHELRTPLTTIRMHAEMLAEGLVDEERRPRVYDELATESVRLSRLVENVLEISRLEEGRRPLRASRADLGAHVREIVDGLARSAANKGFTLDARVPDEPIELHFDAQAIEQVVQNLVDNALKYATSGEKRLEVVVDSDSTRATIRVLDRGPGIPLEERERVFERFHRVERPETAHQPGTGIGLALVRELARAHGGDATAHAREGGGAELRVTLPLGGASPPA